MTRDPYDVLGVPQSATQDEVKAALKRLVFECHSDRPGNGDAARLLEVNAAYQILGDPERRAKHDAEARGEGTGAPDGASPGESIADILRQARERGKRDGKVHGCADALAGRPVRIDRFTFHVGARPTPGSPSAHLLDAYEEGYRDAYGGAYDRGVAEAHQVEVTEGGLRDLRSRARSRPWVKWAAPPPRPRGPGRGGDGTE